MPTVSHDQLLRTLKRALAGAGGIAKRCIRRATVSKKGPIDLVTDADKAADKRIRSIISKAFPDHGLLTEESTPKNIRSPYKWIVDPIDGTTNFAHGIPHASVSIGLEHNGKLLMGGVLDPFRPELYLAVKGKGATLNGQKIRVSKTKDLINSLLVTGFPYIRSKGAMFYLRYYEKFMVRSRGVRRFGSAALDLAYVAAGRFDGYWEFHLHPWDVSAGILLVLEAGGQVTDFRGGIYKMESNAQTLATNGALHPLMLRLLKGSSAARLV
jgi:myo-inositol-1(or 4)-monophosphatase